MKRKLPIHLSFSAILLITVSCAFTQKTEVFFNSTPQIDFAFSELCKVMGDGNIQRFIPEDLIHSKSDVKIALLLLGDANAIHGLTNQEDKLKGLREEGFSIVVNRNGGGRQIYVIGYDEPGLMYGTLELAEQLSQKGLSGVTETMQNPYMKTRGTKFNIPLDVRTPSYTDVCDAAQQNISNMWDIEFWKGYIDNLARNRYNLISLWNLHPFPSMVKVPGYPDVALDDVQRSTTEWKEFYPLEGLGFCTPEILKNAEVLKKITIDEKIEFWRSVMQYGKERNVDFFIITWNVFVYGAQGKYGITDDYKNPVTIDYFRKSVKELLLTYPDLKGIGLTTGENFGKATPDEKEEWAYNTFGLGVLDALAGEPGRRITFIHRQHQTGALEIARKFKPLTDNPDIRFIFSFKYAQAHVFSSTTQPFSNNFVKEIKSAGDLRTIWTLRNDDNYLYRWGAPDYVREFIKNIPYDVTEGFYYGSDQWIWGREFLSKDEANAGQLEIEKHWYHWMLWGRLGYNPDLGNEVFKGRLAEKYPEADPDRLFSAWQDASMIYPVTTGFHWGALDFQWYIEACKSLKGFARNETGFHDVNRFITLSPHPGTRNQSIPSYVNMIMSGGSTDSITPPQVSELLHEHADRALAGLSELSAGDNSELGYLLDDIKAMAYLGKYYAHKIKGAAELQKSRMIPAMTKECQEGAADELTQAANYFKMYIDQSGLSYKNPFWTNRVGYVDWDKIYSWVLDDINIAGQTLNK
jgi:hypothetical protein